MRARVDDLDERVSALETADANASLRSKKDTARRLDPVTLRLLILSLCVLSASGIIKPEALLKMLPVILRLVLGGA